MQNTIIVFLFLTLLVMIIVSESKKLTCLATIGYVVQSIINWVKALLPKEEVYYPTGIGYDANGIFCPGAVEKEFEDLGQVLDGLYLSNQVYNNDLFKYSFKFARAKNDMNGLGLYDYVDKKVLSTVQHYLHRIGNNRVSDYISAITLSDTELNVFLARNQKGEDYNYKLRNSQRNSYNESNIEQKKPRGPIVIKWDEA